jgi:hypothetical protein
VANYPAELLNNLVNRNGMEVRDMRPFIKPTVLALCFMVLVAGIAAETEIDYTQVAEDIEIMARIIDKTLEGEFSDEYKASRALILPFGGSQGCQGIYLKGYGAVFVTSINLPVAERKVSEEEITPDDLWRQTRYELRGVHTGAAAFNYQAYGSDAASGGYDSGKVDQLKEELLRLIGTYGHNIRQLAPQESVVIAVQGTANRAYGIGRIAVNLTKPSPVPKMSGMSDVVVVTEQGDNEIWLKTRKDMRESLKKAEESMEKAEDSTKKAADAFKRAEDYSQQLKKTGGLYVTTASGARGRTTLIIKVSRESIMSYRDEELDLDEFMKQAEITQY